MSARDSSMRERVARLSAAQRAALARRLGLEDASQRPRGERLVAYVVPRGASLEPAELRAFLMERLPQPMIPAVCVTLERMPRTPNGKIDVNALPSVFEDEPVRDDDFVAPASAAEEVLAAVWSEVLGGARIGVHDNFFEIGGDSILSIQVVARAARAGLRLAPDQIFRHQTIAELAQVVERSAPPAAQQGLVEGAVPLTPIQHWFFEQRLAHPEHWHHVLWLEPSSNLELGPFEAALRQLAAHHDALRLRFARKGGRAEQWHGPADAAVPVQRVTLDAIADADLDRVLGEAADSVAAATDLAAAPPMAALVASRDGRAVRVALIVHHLVVDPVSWSILLEDLNRILPALERGERPALAPKTTSFRAWSEALGAAAAEGMRADAEYWLSLPHDDAGLPRDLHGTATEATADTAVRTLDTERTRALLEDVPGAWGTRTDEVLLAALAAALGAWTGRTRFLVGVERHGRESVADETDLSRTIGWFTSFFPLALTVDHAHDAAERLKAIKEQVRAVPSRGISWGILLHRSPDASLRERLRRIAEPQIVLNYGGRMTLDAAPGAPFRPLGVPVSSRAPTNPRAHAIELNAFVLDRRLQLHWTYSTALHHRATVDALAARFMEELHALIDRCAAPHAGGFTPSDFPEADLSQDELDRLLRGLEQ